MSSPGSIFISYRRSDSIAETGRIYDRLVSEFGRDHVFKDVNSIPFGVDFAEYLDQAVSQCQVLLVIIGKTWATVTEPDGTRRLENPDDFVRIEVESALRRNIPVIPVLLEGVSMPKRTQLPESLHPLARRNGTQVGYDPRFHPDMDRLVKGIEKYLSETALIKHIRERCRAKGFTKLPQLPNAKQIQSWISEFGTGPSLEDRINRHIDYHSLHRENPSLSHEQLKTMLSDDRHSPDAVCEVSPSAEPSQLATAADSSPKTIDLGNGVSLDLVHIPGGTFLMGAPASEKDSSDGERPQHNVTVPEFWMGKSPVTQVQYEAAMGNNPSYFPGTNRPVENVSWDDAIAFCEKASQKTGMTFRLPSEAEWEYACRAGTATPFHFGETINTDQANYNGDFVYGNSKKGVYRKKTTPVKTFPPNKFGLYDMHGNVLEWCQDHWHKSYKKAPQDGSPWMKGGNADCRVIRGGSWANLPRICRSAYRSSPDPGVSDISIGFRIVCSALLHESIATEVAIGTIGAIFGQYKLYNPLINSFRGPF